MGLFGEVAALSAAMSYATSSTIFSMTIKSCSPALLNFLRGLVSMIFMYVGVLFFSDSIFPEDSLRNYILLIISGIFGIGIGDCFYFKSLETIGPRKTILLDTLAPPFTGLISYFYYGTTLPLQGWLGIFIVAYGIHTVVNEQNDKSQTENNENIINLTSKEEKQDLEQGIELVEISENSEKTLDKTPINDSPHLSLNESLVSNKIVTVELSDAKKNIIGILCGLCFTFCQAFGMILSHDAASSQKFSALQSALLRVIAGFLCCGVIILVKKGEVFKWPYQSIYENKLFFSACIIGPILGVWSQQTSLIYTRPEISQTILATTPLFGLAISWIRGEQMKPRYLVGSLIAITGVFLIIWTT